MPPNQDNTTLETPFLRIDNEESRGFSYFLNQIQPIEELGWFWSLVKWSIDIAKCLTAFGENLYPTLSFSIYCYSIFVERHAIHPNEYDTEDYIGHNFPLALIAMLLAVFGGVIVVALTRIPANREALINWLSEDDPNKMNDEGHYPLTPLNAYRYYDTMYRSLDGQMLYASNSDNLTFIDGLFHKTLQAIPLHVPLEEHLNNEKSKALKRYIEDSPIYIAAWHQQFVHAFENLSSELTEKLKDATHPRAIAFHPETYLYLFKKNSDDNTNVNYLLAAADQKNTLLQNGWSSCIDITTRKEFKIRFGYIATIDNDFKKAPPSPPSSPIKFLKQKSPEELPVHAVMKNMPLHLTTFKTYDADITGELLTQGGYSSQEMIRKLALKKLIDPRIQEEEDEEETKGTDEEKENNTPQSVYHDLIQNMPTVFALQLPSTQLSQFPFDNCSEQPLEFLCFAPHPLIKEKYGIYAITLGIIMTFVIITVFLNGIVTSDSFFDVCTYIYHAIKENSLGADGLNEIPPSLLAPTIFIALLSTFAYYAFNIISMINVLCKFTGFMQTQPTLLSLENISTYYWENLKHFYAKIGFMHLCIMITGTITFGATSALFASNALLTLKLIEPGPVASTVNILACIFAGINFASTRCSAVLAKKGYIHDPKAYEQNDETNMQFSKGNYGHFIYIFGTFALFDWICIQIKNMASLNHILNPQNLNNPPILKPTPMVFTIALPLLALFALGNTQLQYEFSIRQSIEKGANFLYNKFHGNGNHENENGAEATKENVTSFCFWNICNRERHSSNNEGYQSLELSNQQEQSGSLVNV